jgi:hypothetical protein
MGPADAILSPLRSMCFHLASFFRAELAECRKVWAYNPGRHYMRGPGPKWREKHLHAADMQGQRPIRSVLALSRHWVLHCTCLFSG